MPMGTYCQPLRAHSRASAWTGWKPRVSGSLIRTRMRATNASATDVGRPQRRARTFGLAGEMLSGDDDALAAENASRLLACRYFV